MRVFKRMVYINRGNQVKPIVLPETVATGLLISGFASPLCPLPLLPFAGNCVPAFNGLFAQAATISTTYKKAIANNWSRLLNLYIYVSKPTILHL